MADEAHALLASLPHAHEHVFYTAATPPERLTKDKLDRLSLPADATAYISNAAGTVAGSPPSAFFSMASATPRWITAARA